MQQQWTSSERTLVQGYDRQQRQRLLFRTGLLISIVALALYIIAARRTLFPQTPWTASTLITHLLLDPMLICFWLSVFLAWRGHVRTGALSFVLAAGLFLPIDLLYAGLTNYLSTGGLMYFLAAIAVVGVVGERWMLMATTGIVSLTTILLFALAPRPEALVPYLTLDTINGPWPNLILSWGLAALFLAQRQSYQRVLRDLSNVQIQVERAKRLDELKDQFIRSVNHELRTPIMTILGYLDILMRPENRAAPELLDRFISNAYHTGEALRALLTSILDIRRIDMGPGELSLQSLNLVQTVKDIVPLLPPDQHPDRADRTTQRDLQLNISPKLTIWAEPVMMQQILLNLLANAIKYSNPGTPVEVSAEHVQEKADNEASWPLPFAAKAGKEHQMVEIAVRDHGFGIPSDQAPLLFQRFARLPRDLESNIVGTGLGLYTCRALAEKMGGRIWVESTGIPGEGSTFFLRLPMPTTK